MKNVWEATHTVQGQPVWLTMLNGGGDYPVFGAYWVDVYGRWVQTQWDEQGRNIRNGVWNLDLREWEAEKEEI